MISRSIKGKFVFFAVLLGFYGLLEYFAVSLFYATLPPVANRTPSALIRQGDVVSAMSDGRLVALARINGGEIKPLRVMNL